jgi:rhodanese-related sulfurtransferase
MTLLSRLFSRPEPAPAEWVDPDQLAALLRGPAPPVVIDVRGPDEFTGPLGHIGTARNIPLDQIDRHAADLLAERQPLVMVCHTDRRSGMAAQRLRSQGSGQVSVLRGGMVAWRARTP